MNFDFGIRRGDVIESGEEARKGDGEDMVRLFRAFSSLFVIVSSACYRGM